MLRQKKKKVCFSGFPDSFFGPTLIVLGGKNCKTDKNTLLFKKTKKYNDLFVLRFYGPVNRMESCLAWFKFKVYPTTFTGQA